MTYARRYRWARRFERLGAYRYLDMDKAIAAALNLDLNTTTT